MIANNDNEQDEARNSDDEGGSAGGSASDEGHYHPHCRWGDGIRCAVDTVRERVAEEESVEEGG